MIMIVLTHEKSVTTTLFVSLLSLESLALRFLHELRVRLDVVHAERLQNARSSTNDKPETGGRMGAGNGDGGHRMVYILRTRIA